MMMVNMVMIVTVIMIKQITNSLLSMVTRSYQMAQAGTVVMPVILCYEKEPMLPNCQIIYPVELQHHSIVL